MSLKRPGILNRFGGALDAIGFVDRDAARYVSVRRQLL